jgi:murein DD-endopeptidase MepM/ murein hydrolase activator NlpD
MLKSESAGPDKAFFFGEHAATYRYKIGGDQPRHVKIQAVNRKTWHVAKVWRKRGVDPGVVHKVRWSGRTRGGKAARKGTYLFRVKTRQGKLADRSRLKRSADRSFKLYPEKFPVRARHTYGDGYGAPRAGHIHQGQDVMAQCGKPVVAARGGRIQYRANQAGGAGYYLVVDGRSSGQDYVYMHLQRRGRPKSGARVHTGEQIGWVGHTGDATACHLHFELWSRPGWYEGGHAMRSVTKHLKAWDRWS